MSGRVLAGDEGGSVPLRRDVREAALVPAATDRHRDARGAITTWEA
jgi:hypothetical protein